jgi:hypothetical protein
MYPLGPPFCPGPCREREVRWLRSYAGRRAASAINRPADPSTPQLPAIRKRERVALVSRWRMKKYPRSSRLKRIKGWWIEKKTSPRVSGLWRGIIKIKLACDMCTIFINQSITKCKCFLLFSYPNLYATHSYVPNTHCINFLCFFIPRSFVHVIPTIPMIFIPSFQTRH